MQAASGSAQVTLDVRDELRDGRAPFPRIMATVAGLETGQSLRLLTLFEPRPLYEVLNGCGFEHRARCLGDGGWEVVFSRKQAGHGLAPPVPLPSPSPSSIRLRPSQASCRAFDRRTALADRYAPETGLPLAFLVLSLGSAVVGVAVAVIRPELLTAYHYTQYAVAFTHAMVLGVCLSAMHGVLYQMVPVTLTAPLHNRRLAHWHFWAHAVGATGMVWMFWVWNLKQVGHFGSLVALGVGWFLYNIGRTIARTRERSWLTWGLAAALGWLGVAVLAGLYLAASKCWTFSPFETLSAMHAHAHAGIGGAFVLLLVPVSLRLIALFTVSEVRSPARVRWSLVLAHSGMAGVFFCVLVQSRLKFVTAGITAAGLILYGLELVAILRQRRRRHLDWSLRYLLTAIAMLLPVTGLGLGLATRGTERNGFIGQCENLYGFLALFGVLTLAILGMALRIVPFLLWYWRFHGSRPGTAAAAQAAGPARQAPLLSALGYVLLLAGLVLTAGGILIAHDLLARLGMMGYGGGVGCVLLALLQAGLGLRPRSD